MRRAEFRTRDIEPCKKRRKLDNQNEQQGQGEEVRCTQDAEKRKKPQEERPSKKQRTLDKYILSRTEPQQNKEQRPDVRNRNNCWKEDNIWLLQPYTYTANDKIRSWVMAHRAEYELH